MKIFKYSAGSADTGDRQIRIHSGSLLKALSERLLKNYNLATALEKIKWDGLVDLQEQRVDGLAKMLEQVRSLREDLQNTYTFDHLLDGVRDALRERCRSSLEAPAPENISEEEKAGREKIKEISDWLEVGFPAGLGERMAHIQAVLVSKGTPDKTISAVWDDLWENISGLRLLVRAKEISDLSVVFSAFEELRGLLESEEDKGRAYRIAAYPAGYGRVLDLGAGWEEAQSHLRKKRVILHRFFGLIPFPVRMALEQLVEIRSGQDSVGLSLLLLWQAVDRTYPPSALKQYRFCGKRRLNPDAGLALAEKLCKLEDLEDQIVKAGILGDNGAVNGDLVREILGELAGNSLQKLNRMIDVLVADGYLAENEGAYRLTSTAFRRIGQLALSEILPQFDRRRGGKPESRKNEAQHSISGNSRAYEFGDALHIDVSATFSNALKRNGVSGSASISLDPSDFEIHVPEGISRTSTVLLLDMSSSMADKFPKAKKMAIALRELITRYFPGDRIAMVGFYTLSRRISGDELFNLEPIPFYPANIPKEWSHGELRRREKCARDFPGDFTNMQEGLRISREILSRDRYSEKNIFLLTDGEPTACTVGGRVLLEQPPGTIVFEQTLKEVRKCTLSGIHITTFMLSENSILADFVKSMERINRGKAFLTPPSEMDHYVVLDYLRKKSYRIHGSFQ